MQKKYLVPFGIIIGVYLGMKYLVPLFIPFLFAGIIVMIINPCVVWMHRKLKINKGIAATVIMIITGGLLSALVWMAGDAVMCQFRRFLPRIGIYENELCRLVRDSCQTMEQTFGIDAVNIETLVLENINVMVDSMQVNIIPDLMNDSFIYVKGAAEFFGAVMISVISVVLLSKDLEKISEQCRHYEWFHVLCEIIQKVASAIWTFLKSQLIIMIITGILCITALWIMKNPYALIIGIIIGLLDALPFIGTGLILIPWTLVEAVNQNYTNALILGILFIVCSISRELLEPRLIGKKLGIYPIVIMLAIYVGIKLYGISGIITGPVSLLIIYELCCFFFRKETTETTGDSYGDDG
ncbi:MAG: AI-2E family transporter [bacterium]|nr:AI-2E family transporter [bacterium]